MCSASLLVGSLEPNWWLGDGGVCSASLLVGSLKPNLWLGDGGVCVQLPK